MIKYIKILVITIILGLLIGGCSTSLNVSVDDEIDNVNIKISKSQIIADGKDYIQITAIAFDSDGYEVDTSDYSVKYKVNGNTYNDSKFTSTTAGTYDIQVGVDGIWSNTVTVEVKSALKIANYSKSTSFHLITWEPLYNSKEYQYWFTPDLETTNFSYEGSHNVPTLKSGSSFTNTVVPGSSYLYFVMTGKTDFAYYRTTDKISIGNSSADYKEYRFYDDTIGVETDSNQNDIPANIVLREVIGNGVRATEKDINIIRIK